MVQVGTPPVWSHRRVDPAEAPGRTPWRTDHPLLGCDYNPEQWPREVWHEDVRLMREAGVELVAVNIFGWAEVQPAADRFAFDRLDEVLDLLHEHRIGVNLGTGTASPPPWLTTAYPQVLPVAEDGTTRWPGGRQAWCPSSPVFRELSLALVDRVASRYGRHPALRLWHVSNELGGHNSLCYCDVSAEAFRRWLRERYGRIEAVNEAWGTSFWSQRYGTFEEILPPRLTLSTPNPGQALDFHRFSSDELLAQHRAEAEVIRTRSPLPVTTNLMVTAHQRDMDYWDWAPHLDVVANDHYLDHRLADPAAELAFCADLTRGLAQGRPWILMEHATGAVNWQPVNIAKQPGELLRGSVAHLARGADALCFFQWRASRQGAEKFHSAMLPHAGTDSATWREVLELGRILRALPDLAGTRVSAEVALVFSYENWWAADAPNRPSELVVHLEQVHQAYAALRAAGVGVDIVPPGAALQGYRVVVVPHLYLVRDAEAAVLEDFVAGGGHALVTFFSGIVDEDDRVRPGGYPGAFRDLLGVTVEEVHPLPEGVALALEGAPGGTVRRWTERVRLDGARAHRRLGAGPLAGHPAVTVHEHGTGRAWYAAADLDPDAQRALVEEVLAGAGVQPEPGAGPQVEVVRRRAEPVGSGPDFLFVLNHGPDTVLVPARGSEVCTGEDVDPTLEVPAGAVRIVRLSAQEQS
ncbi:beta-galactosidase [uncultured Serinicoccus sp.]|uniref:beta-galactosidase n=1 Tax=uncultured Serinicoccus sp. TaxID=735514 RepID=UPI00262215BC|nr:beta-galactosidase [uncultured Serinicoccus sp.]